MKHLQLLLRSVALLTIVGACGPAQEPCADATRACIVLDVRGTGPVSGLRTALSFVDGHQRFGGSPEPFDLPAKFQVEPPSGEDPSRATQLRVEVLRGARPVSIRTIDPLGWGPGVHLYVPVVVRASEGGAP